MLRVDGAIYRAEKMRESALTTSLSASAAQRARAHQIFITDEEEYGASYARPLLFV